VDLTVDGSDLPELRIDGYVSGRLVKSVSMSSDPSRDHLGVQLEDVAIVGDGSDATRFTFRALDAYGNQRPYVGGDVTLSLSGPARLIAQNPFPFAMFGGVGGAVICSNPGQSGTVAVSASHPSLGQASARLLVTAPSGQYR
jgi:beta-galactosidase